MAKIDYEPKMPAPSKFDELPAGKYYCECTDCEIKDTKAGTGSYIAFVWEVAEGPHVDRKIFSNLNIKNDNPKTVEIAEGHLDQICAALGMTGRPDTDDFIGKKLTIVMRDDKREPGKTKAVAYETASASGVTSNIPARKPVPTAPGASKPWAK